MSNSYYKYLSYNQLVKKYLEVFSLLEDSEGEIDEEINIKLLEIEDDVNTLLYDVLNIIDNLEKEKQLNKERIENLNKQNKSFDSQIAHLDGIVKNLVKQQGKLNPNNNFAHKIGERKLSVVKKEVYEVEDDFNDNRFIKYKLNSKIDPLYVERISKFLEQRGEESEMEKIIEKAKLNDAIKNGEKIENVNSSTKEILYKR